MQRSARFAGAAVIALLSTGCLPPSVSPLGHPCDDAHLCPSPLACVANVCVSASDAGSPDGGDAGSDAGTPDAGTRVNILQDGDFSAGPLESLQYWHGDNLQIQTLRVRSGNYSAQISADGAGTASLGTTPVESIPLEPGTAPGLFCAEAWVTSDQGAVPFLQLVRTAFDTSQIASGSLPSSVANLDGGTDWIPLESSILRVSSDLALDLTITTPLQSSASLFIDDVTVWASTDGTCP
jgi:hypothetical protein